MSLFLKIENDIDETVCRIVEYEKKFDDHILKVQQWLKEVFENPSQSAKQLQKRGRKRPVIETIPEKNEESSLTEDDDAVSRNSKRHHSDEENITKSPDNNKNVDLKPESTTKEQNEIETTSKPDDQPLTDCPKINSDKTNNEITNSIKKTNDDVSKLVKETNQNSASNSETLETQPVGRSKRAASQVARLMTSKALNSHLNTKLRRPEEFNTKFEVQIKEEKLSIIPPIETCSKNEISNSRNKRTRRKKNDNDNNDEPQSNIVIKQEKPEKAELSTRTRNKQKLKKDKNVAPDKNGSLDNDDIEIHSVPNELVVLSDSEDETPDKDNDQVVEKQKLDEKIVEKSSNELSEKHLNEQKEHEQSVYEDAVDEEQHAAPPITSQCTVQLNRIDDTELNATYNVANKPHVDEEIDSKSAIKKVMQLNETVVIESNKQTKNKKTPPLLNETVTISKDQQNTNANNNDQFKKSPVLAKSQNYSIYKNQKLFSPSQGLVKKRVIEIEKLNGSPTPTPTPAIPTGRITRTKTRALKAATTLATDELKENIEESKEGNQPDGKSTKYQKPLQTLRLNDLTSSKTKPANISKINNIANSSENLLKSVNILKSKTDLRDEELRKKLEKLDVVKKRDAILSAKVEEQKRKREEKALKAQLVREQKEKERQQHLERQERERLEKQKQAQLERELKKKEIERKAALAEQRAKEIEDRRKAEDMARHQRLLELEEAERKREPEAESTYQKRVQDETDRVFKIPAMYTPKESPPRTTLDLNTDDEDSDEETKRDIPMWSKSQFRYSMAKQQQLLHNGALLRLFNSQPLVSINLKRIFPEIETSRLRRNSSAVWRTPPRYSQMKKF